MKIVIFGGRGYIGSQLSERYPNALAPETDIADPLAVASVLDEYKPSIVINAAGKTGRPNVDWCEDHKMETLRSNVTGPLVLLEACLKRDIYFVQVGSGCIYSGFSKPGGFTEEDEPNFTGSFYSFSKAMADRLLAPFPVLQLRIRMPFDGTTSARNLLMKLVKYKKVLDCENSLTYFPDFLATLQALVLKRATGIYNVVNPGTLSPYAIMQRYREVVDPTYTCERLTLDHIGSVVKAPRSNCVLSSEKLKASGISLRTVHEVLEEALNSIKAKN